MIETITVSSRGQVVIPERVREQLQIEEGMKLVLIQEGDQIILKKENLFLQKVKEQQERNAWISLGEAAFAQVWNNVKDETTWKRYL